jgi:Zn-dependent M16 (insulinase) family peptidase
MTTLTHGFELIREQEIPELNATARLWRHARTGADLLSMEVDDENKVFSIVFRTPISDSTGVPHIMEHAVLAGSQKYPLKEPFIELVKGSLASFVNAMTGDDTTYYPTASTNLQDFYNLIDVYVDAVFNPLLTPHHLAQEGWHYELDEPDASLSYKGVVFNEMKGVYSSPDSVLGRFSQQALFPDTPYQFDSGGDPTVIPQLTYEQFKAFHDTYYHPSNALIYFYGDDDPDERLRLMNDYLRDFEAAEVDATIALQPALDAPRRVSFPYSVSADENGQAAKAYMQLNWLLPEGNDVNLTLALSVLSYALLATPASPLRKALIDSGLGERVTGSGLSESLRQMTFSAGLKGLAPDKVDDVEALILRTLEELAAEGFDPAMIDAALNTIEFRLRENNTGRFPRGLALLFNATGPWRHGYDMLEPLAYEAPLTAVKARLKAEPGYLQALIREHLLDNPHRVTVVLEPDAELAARTEAEEQARLRAAETGLSAADRAAIAAETAEIKRRQETPDAPEVLATLPMLALSDLDPDHKPLPLMTTEMADTEVITHDLFTNGIVYMDVAMNLHALPSELLPYVPLFGKALVSMGTQTEDFVRLSQRIGSQTGGISPSSFIAPVRDHDATAAWLLLRGKATLERAPQMLDILRDILLTVKLDDRDRFRQIVLESKSAMEGGLIPAGHMLANSRLRAHFNEAHRLEETMGGVEQLFFLRALAEEVEQDWPAVLAKLMGVRERLVKRQAMVINVTLDDEGMGQFGPQLTGFLEALPLGTFATADWTPTAYPAREGLAIPAQVNYVGKGADLKALGYETHGSIMVINNLLRTGYLWERLRMQGGAYGAFATYSANSGVYAFLSYRDPNLIGSLANYDGAAAWLRGLTLSDDELTRAIIGVIGAIDAYLLPDAKGFTSMTRYLTNETDDHLQTLRDQVLSTTLDDLHAFADVLDQVAAQGDVVVLGSAEALAKANEAGLGLDVVKVM